MKGIGLVGALAVLADQGFEPQNIAGTSAGAIAAVLLAAGYTPKELHSILSGLEFERFKDRAWEDRLPLGVPLSIIKDKGIYEGEEFLEWIRGLLAHQGVHTFADLVHTDYADQPKYRYRAQVIASDITAHELLVLPRDAERFGVDPDELDVAEAVRMSMSIPIFFEPWRWHSPAHGKDHLIVDGGVLSNFPVWLFDADGEPDWPTFGLMLVEGDPRQQVGARIAESTEAAAEADDTSVLEFVKDLVQTMLEAHDRMFLQTAAFARTIQIPTVGVATTEFDLSRKPEKAEALYESGRRAATEFLDQWDFEAYKETFRARKPAPSRRELIQLAADLRR